MEGGDGGWGLWVRKNKLTTVGCVWATGIAGSLAYNWSKRIPTSLKIIHSRVYAQAITITALGVVGVIETFLVEQNPDLKPVEDEQGRVWR